MCYSYKGCFLCRYCFVAEHFVHYIFRDYTIYIICWSPCFSLRLKPFVPWVGALDPQTSGCLEGWPGSNNFHFLSTKKSETPPPSPASKASTFKAALAALSNSWASSAFTASSCFWSCWTFTFCLRTSTCQRWAKKTRNVETRKKLRRSVACASSFCWSTRSSCVTDRFFSCQPRHGWPWPHVNMSWRPCKATHLQNGGLLEGSSLQLGFQCYQSILPFGLSRNLKNAVSSTAVAKTMVLNKATSTAIDLARNLARSWLVCWATWRDVEKGIYIIGMNVRIFWDIFDARNSLLLQKPNGLSGSASLFLETFHLSWTFCCCQLLYSILWRSNAVLQSIGRCGFSLSKFLAWHEKHYELAMFGDFCAWSSGRYRSCSKA